MTAIGSIHQVAPALVETLLNGKTAGPELKLALHDVYEKNRLATPDRLKVDYEVGMAIYRFSDDGVAAVVMGVVAALGADINAAMAQVRAHERAQGDNVAAKRKAIHQVAPALVEILLNGKTAGPELNLALHNFYEKNGLATPDRLKVDYEAGMAIYHFSGQGVSAVVMGVVAALGADINAAMAQIRAHEDAAAKLEVKNQEDAAAKLRATTNANLVRSIVDGPPSKNGLPKAAVALVESGAWALSGDDGVVATMEKLVERGWERAPLEASITQAAVGTLFEFADPLKPVTDLREVVLQRNAFAKALVFSIVDQVVPTGVKAPYLYTKSGQELIPVTLTTEYVEALAARTTDEASRAKVACGLERLGWNGLIDRTAYVDFLRTDPKVSATADWLAGIALDDARVIYRDTRLTGLIEVGGAHYAPSGTARGDTNAILRIEAGISTPVITTGKWLAKSLQARGAEIFALSVNNDVCYLEVFDRDSGSLQRRVRLPPPINHVNGYSTALTDDGHFLYGSSNKNSHDVLALVDPSFDGEDPQRAENMLRVTAQAPKGFKIKGVTVDGGHAFVAMMHDAKHELRIVRYNLPTLRNPTDVIAHPMPQLGRFGGGEICMNASHIIISGGAVLHVFERDGGTARLTRSIPSARLCAIRFSVDGSANAVFANNNPESAVKSP
ncbi:MAG: hypothetical protein H7Z43_14320 [Clostridia bacterium]|nr:hypothetical protein [Deltaproteobacteria bacterium]